MISNQTLTEEEVTPVEGEGLHVGVVDEAEEGEGTEEVEGVIISKLTTNRRFITKVGMSKHSPLNLLSLLPSKILLHFLVRQLKVLQIKILSKVNYKDN